METAEQLMTRAKLTAGLDETVDAVLQRMALTGKKEIAVLDAEGRILADINAVDLLRYFHLDHCRSGLRQAETEAI